jgi:hypothetical protein
MNPKTVVCRRLYSLVLQLDHELQQLQKELSTIDRVLNGRPEKGWIEWKYVKCGKKSCSCQLGKGHGPYAYLRYWENNKLKSIYLGKTSRISIPEQQKQTLQQRRKQIQKLISKLEQAILEAEKLLTQTLNP